MTDAEHPAVRMLNRAFEADPTAIHALLTNRVPCNAALADDPTIVTGGPRWDGPGGPDEPATVGAIGLLNGLLGELGMPRVAYQVEGGAGAGRLVGFAPYSPPAPTVEVPAETDPTPSHPAR